MCGILFEISLTQNFMHFRGDCAMSFVSHVFTIKMLITIQNYLKSVRSYGKQLRLKLIERLNIDEQVNI